MKRLIIAVILVLLPAFARADSFPTAITPACGLAVNGSTTQTLYAVGTLSASIARNPQTGSSYGLPAAATCGAVTIRSNSGSAMTDTVPAAATYGAGFMWISNADTSATDTLSGGFSGGLQAGQNILLTSDGTTWSQAGGSFFASASQARANLGLGTAATQNTGTSGATIPLNNGGFTQSGVANFTGGLQANGTAQTFPGSGSIAGTSDTQTLTNKTINGGLNTLSNIPFTAMTGQATLGQLPSLPAQNIYCNSMSSAAVPAGCQIPALHSKDFGAVPDGSTNNNTALQNWLSACVASQVVCFLDPGPSCYLISSALSATVSNAVTIFGAGLAASIICQSSTTADTLDITAPGAFPLNLAYIGIAPSVSQSAGTCVSVTSSGATNQNTTIFDSNIGGISSHCNTAISLGTANHAVIDSSDIRANGVAISAQLCGDSKITNNTVIGVGTGAIGIKFIGSATANGCGMIIAHNKIQSNVSAVSGAAIEVNGGTSGAQSDIIIADNSIEGWQTEGIHLVQGSFTSFANLTIIGNQLGNDAQLLVTDNSTAGWLSRISITGNIFEWPGASTGMVIGAAFADFLVADNTFDELGASGTVISIASGAANGLVQNNQVFNTAAAAYITNASTSTRIIDSNGMAFLSLPSAAAVGSQIYVNNATAGTSTCNGSGTGTLAIRVNSGTPAWRCF